MRISIVIPAFNEEKLIEGTLHAVKTAMAAFTAIGWEPELIVCDNNSSDRTAEIARAAGAHVVFEADNQIARARNRGASAASGDWLLFIDADSQPTRELFEDVAEQIRAGRCVAGGSTVKLDGHFPLARLGTGLWNFLSRRRLLLAGSFIFCEAAAFRIVGGFSQELFAGEELELTRKLKEFAASTNKTIVILQGHPLLTSARKAHLYTLREHLWFLAKTVFGWGKTLNSREACHTWYDGRR